MNLNYDFSKYFNPVKPAGPKAETAPVSTKQGTPVTGEKTAEPATLHKADSSKNISKQGSAEPVVKNAPKDMTEAWTKAASKGEKINFDNMPPAMAKSKVGVLNYLTQDYSKKYSDSERSNITKFFSDVMNNSSKLSDPLKRKDILNIMADGIKTKGLSTKQMDMVANGTFKADAYIDMVNKTGEPIG